MESAAGRQEIKHSINSLDMLELRSRLKHLMGRDKNAPEGTYIVRSLYFDNYDNKALMEKINGLYAREKFRLRYYGDNTDEIKLEKKSKKGSVCFKESAEITGEECARLLRGDYAWMRDSKNPLMLEFYIKITSQMLRPKCVVQYKREPYVYPAGNVRVTIDYDLRFSSDVWGFLSPGLALIPRPGEIVLEVKYDNFLPGIIEAAVSLGRGKNAFSKYALARQIY